MELAGVSVFFHNFVAACGSDLGRPPRASVTVLDEAIDSVLFCLVQFSSVSISSTAGSTDFVGCPLDGVINDRLLEHESMDARRAFATRHETVVGRRDAV